MTKPAVISNLNYIMIQLNSFAIYLVGTFCHTLKAQYVHNTSRQMQFS